MSNIQTGAERMPHDLSHLGFLAGQIGRLITISTTPVIAGRSEERFSRNAETDLVCRLLLEKKKYAFYLFFFIFVLSTLRLSCSTLFPYTTLFRSILIAGASAPYLRINYV